MDKGGNKTEFVFFLHFTKFLLQLSSIYMLRYITLTRHTLSAQLTSFHITYAGEGRQSVTPLTEDPDITRQPHFTAHA